MDRISTLIESDLTIKADSHQENLWEQIFNNDEANLSRQKSQDASQRSSIEKNEFSFLEVPPLFAKADIDAEGAKTVRALDRLRADTGLPRLSAEQKKAIVDLPPFEKSFFQFAVSELIQLRGAERLGKPQRAAHYMGKILSEAAKRSEKTDDPHKSYIKAIGMVFSDPKGGGNLELARSLAGSSPHTIGALIEQTYKALTWSEQTTSGGFNANIIDGEYNNSTGRNSSGKQIGKSDASTISHHFRELLLVAYSRGFQVGIAAADQTDPDPYKNPGDIRNGYFAAMIGEGLRRRTISPSEASNLVSWAYLYGKDGKTALWGDQPQKADTFNRRTESWLDKKQYDLSDWKEAYEKKWKRPLKNPNSSIYP